MDERAIHTVETKSEQLTDNNGTFCCVPTAPYRLVSLDVSGDGRKARNDSDKHAEIDVQKRQTVYPYLFIRSDWPLCHPRKAALRDSIAVCLRCPICVHHEKK